MPNRAAVSWYEVAFTCTTVLFSIPHGEGPDQANPAKTNSISKHKVKRRSRNALVRVAIRRSFAPSLLGNPLGILKPSRSRSPENAAANVRQVGNAACLHIGYGSGI